MKNCGFKPRPFRTDGTYTKYAGIDDKVECVNFYTIYVKFGIGRATYDVSQDLRNDHISIDEAKLLIKKYDGEFPKRYFNDVMNYLDIEPNYFLKHLNKFRSPHLWKKVGNKWKLKHTAY